MKSNYEKYAEAKQPKLLHKERTLQQAISCLKDRQKFASLQSIDRQRVERQRRQLRYIHNKAVLTGCVRGVWQG